MEAMLESTETRIAEQHRVHVELLGQKVETMKSQGTTAEIGQTTSVRVTLIGGVGCPPEKVEADKDTAKAAE